MEPIVAGGLVLGMTVGALVFVGLCNAIANKLASRFIEPARAPSVPEMSAPAKPELRRSA